MNDADRERIVEKMQTVDIGVYSRNFIIDALDLISSQAQRIEELEKQLRDIYGLNERGDSLIGDIWRLALNVHELCEVSHDAITKAFLPQITPLIKRIEERMKRDDPPDEVAQAAGAKGERDG